MFLIAGLSFIAGLLLGYILFTKITFLSKFEKMIMAGLVEGKRVIVSLDNDAYIFELNGNRIRVTAGIVDIMEELPHGVNMENIDSAESIDNDTTVL